MRVKAGCCGLAGMGLNRYAGMFRIIELQSTFYRLPTVETAERWRNQVPKNFDFSVKAFQGVTHPISSPTWRRAGTQRPKERGENYGHLQPTEENFECWERTLEICRAVNAVFCVVQLPPSFDNSAANLVNMASFFQTAKRGPPLGIEFRHPSWFASLGELRGVLEGLKAVGVVDPLLKTPLPYASTAYYRLHGLGRRPYSYQHTPEDLARLKRRVLEQRIGESFVMFNNIAMKEDCLRFMELLKREASV